MPHTILPPDLLDRIVRSGDRESRTAALDTLAIDHLLRIRRSDRTPPEPTMREGAGGAGSPDRSIFDVHGQESGDGGTLVRSEGDEPTGDPAADEAYDGLGRPTTSTGRSSSAIRSTARGLPLVGWVHYGPDYDNAFWDGSRWSSATATAGSSSGSRARST